MREAVVVVGCPLVALVGWWLEGWWVARQERNREHVGRDPRSDETCRRRGRVGFVSARYEVRRSSPLPPTSGRTPRLPFLGRIGSSPGGRGPEHKPRP